jgi:hypothetical protein
MKVKGNLFVDGSIIVTGEINKGNLRAGANSRQASDVVNSTATYMNDSPPSNNVTNLALAFENNTDGSINVNISWNYDPTGLIKADGFLVYYKSGTSAPDVINLVLDPAVFVAADKTSTAYAHVLPALSGRYGGAGTVTRHYRFAVVAVGTRRSGTIPHVAGVVENTGAVPAPGSGTWIDAQFVPNITSEEGGATLNMDGLSLVWRDFATGAELARIRYDGATAMLKASKLAAIVRFRGSWIYNGTWNSETVVNAASSRYSALSLLPDGTTRFVYQRYSDLYLVQRIRSTGGVWGSETVVNAAISYYPALSLLPDGTTRVVYMRGDSYLVQRICSTAGVWGSETVINAASQYPALSLLPDGTTRVVYQRSDTYLVQRICSTGGVWGSETVVNAAFSNTPSLSLLPDGTTLVVYQRNSDHYLMQRICSTGGVWGSETPVNAAVSTYSTLSLLPDGTTRLVYQKDGGYLVQRIRSTGGVWGSETVVNAASSYYPAISLLPDGTTLVVYMRGDSYLVQRIDSSYYSSIPIKDDYAYVGSGIVETGQNSNGNYIKFDDGTMECRMKVPVSGSAPSFGCWTSWNPRTVSLPAAFIDTSYQLWTQGEGSFGVGMQGEFNNTTTTTSFTGNLLNAWNGAATSSPNSYLNILAIGRWK